jgi:hypothetical protein
VKCGKNKKWVVNDPHPEFKNLRFAPEPLKLEYLWIKIRIIFEGDHDRRDV